MIDYEDYIKLAFDVLITRYDNAFSWKRKGFEGLQAITFSITNNTPATVRLPGAVLFERDIAQFEKGASPICKRGRLA